jgi:poly(3-hydroxybutyrate) depolymerase
MSQRLALEHADLIAAIACMTGAGIYYDPNACHPSQPERCRSGALDGYLGGLRALRPAGHPCGSRPGQNVQIWAGLNGCQDPVLEAAPSLDVTTQVAGIDTTVMRYTQCPPGGSVELWTVNGGDHYLFWNQLTPQFLPLLVDWLLAHPKS